MGSIGCRKLHRVLENLEKILAVELLCACQGLDFRRPLRTTPVLEACHAAVRAVVPHAVGDRVFADDLTAVVDLVQSGRFLSTAREAAADTGVDLGEMAYSDFTRY